jgi:ABC-type glycerol-3-phosphate transport system permease component
VLPYLTFSTPLAIWLLTGFFRQLPRDLEEAAMLDGASRLRALRDVVLPLAAPGLASTAILTFLYCWNEFLFALSFTLGPERIHGAGGHRALPGAVSGAVGTDSRGRRRSPPSPSRSSCSRSSAGSSRV